jgi:hypothetical protein
MQNESGTTIDIAAEASRLEEIYKDLQRANLTVGYLESRLKDYEEQSKALVLAKAKAEKLSDFERENQEMLEIYEQAKIAEELAEHNELLRQRIRLLEPSYSKPKPYTMEDYYMMIQRHLER